MKKDILKEELKKYEWKLLTDFSKSLEKIDELIDTLKKDAIKAIRGGVKELNLSDDKIKHAIEIYEATIFKAIIEKRNFAFWLEIYNKLNEEDHEQTTSEETSL